MKTTFLAILATIILCLTSCDLDTNNTAPATATQPEAVVVPPVPFSAVSHCYVEPVGVMTIVKDNETGIEYIVVYFGGGLAIHKREH